ncbi:MAG: PspC domain-containing protein [Candidatus Obscuribacterales bacterium]|nr:PspC domain-containing protein [Steroidobacteraceae bacterium]
MQRVFIVNLNGLAYQLDQDAYEALQIYLDHATAKLKSNPDRTEILADLERSIGEKCSAFVSSSKNVVTLGEVSQVLKDIGPVDGVDGVPNDNLDPAESIAKNNTEPKQLFQIRDGAVISGVCKGMSEYFNIDVIGFRIGFVLLALLTSGGWGIFYVALMFIIPFDPRRPPSMENGIPAWSYNFVNKVKGYFGASAAR